MALQVAFFVTSHGFGHAARACAVMYQLRQMYDDIHFHIFSSLPTHVFTLELIGSAYFYNNSIDVGVKQNGALDFDLNATARSLEVFLSGFDADAERLAVQLHALRCDWVICDIAPLGIAAATYLGLPVVLIENFSWSWIYSGFQYDHPVLRDAIDKFDSVRKMAGLKIQASPCFFTDDADYVVAPISRPVLCPPGDVRVNLGISPGEKLVLVSLGGFQYHMRNMATAAARQGVRYLVLGQPESWHEGNVIALSTREYVYLPDVVEACDAVVTKLGYSTLAEVWASDTPVAYLSRAEFAENAILEEFVVESLCSLKLTREELDEGHWVSRVADVLLVERSKTRRVSGAMQAAVHIKEWMSGN